MRTLGANNLWDTASWDDGESTWAEQPIVSDLLTVLASDPAPTDGVSVGPFDPNGLRFIVQAMDPSLGSLSPWDAAGSLYDTSLWSSSVGDWLDVSGRVRGVTWKNGTTSPTGRADVGTATVTFNNLDGHMSPWATAGTYTFNGQSWIKAGMLIRWGVLNTVTIADSIFGFTPLAPFNAFFTGRIETVVEETAENVDSWLTVTVVETMADLRGAPLDQAYAAQEATSAIYNSALEQGWTYQDTMDVPDTDANIAANTQTGGTVIERMRRFADCGHMDVLVNGRGQLEVVSRKAASADTVLIFFTNEPTGSDFPVVQILPYSSVERVINDAVASSPTGMLQEAEDLGSQDQFGPVGNVFGFPRNDLPMADADVLLLAQRVIALRSLDDLGIQQIDLTADQDPVRLPTLMTYIAAYGRSQPAFHVHWVHPGGGVFNQAVVIEGQSHSVTMEGGQLMWTCSLTTAKATS